MNGVAVVGLAVVSVTAAVFWLLALLDPIGAYDRMSSWLSYPWLLAIVLTVEVIIFLVIGAIASRLSR